MKKPTNAQLAEVERLVMQATGVLYWWLAGAQDIAHLGMAYIDANDGQAGLYYCASTWIGMLNKHSGVASDLKTIVNVEALDPSQPDHPVKHWCYMVIDLYLRNQTAALWEMFADDDPRMPLPFRMTTLLSGIVSSMQMLPQGYGAIGTDVPKVSEQVPLHRVWGTPWDQ